MKPTKSNTADKGCSPVSSNCVVWQGPDLSCINLCNGDTVSDVIYKIAENLCAAQLDAGLSDLDLTCLLTVCQATPEPAHTLSAVLGLLIDKVCCLSDLIDNLPSGGGDTYVEPTLNLPACLQYVNGQGQTITSLPHSQFTLTMAQKVCALNTTVGTHTSQIANHETRVTILENKPAATLPTVTPKCVGVVGVPAALDVVLTNVEDELCKLKTAVGSNTQITASAAQQCSALGSATALSTTGTMSGLSGWNNSITNLSQSFQNLWITVCDIRAAVSALQHTTANVDCSAFLLSFSAAANNDRTQVTLYFAGSLVVPSGFTDCNQQGSKVTISDGLGHSYIGYVSLVTESTNQSGITFTVSGASLNTSQPYTVLVEGCLTKSGNTCSKNHTETISVPCPLVTGVTASLI